MKAKKYADGGIGPNKNTDGGIGPRKKRKAAEAARKAQFEEQLANATIPLWERESMLRERLRFLHAEMKELSEKEGISMDDAYVRYNGDNWAEDPRYKERMARIKAAKGIGGMMEIERVGFYEEGGKMRVKKYSTKPITPDPKKKAPVGGVAQRTKAEETAFEERRIEGMRESLREGEGLKSLQDYDKELAAKGYSFPNGSSIKVKKYEAGGMVGGDPKKTPKYAKAEDYYMNEGQPFLAQALKERNIAGRKGTGEDVKTMWEGVKKSNPRLANELLQRAKQFRMEAGGEYSIGTSKAPGYSY